jgi:hypothetical protein
MNEYCLYILYYYFYFYVKETHFSYRYTLLLIDPKEYNHYNLSEEAKLLLPDVTAHLQTGNIRIWPTSKEDTQMQPVLHRCDLPNSAK